MVENGPVVSEKSKFYFSYVNNPDDIDLEDSHFLTCLSMNYRDFSVK